MKQFTRRSALFVPMMPAIIGLAHAGTKPLMGAGKPFVGGGGTATSVTFSASTITGTTSITAPATINAGDLLVIANFAESGTTPTTLTPTGFTTLQDTLSGARRLVTSYKKAAGTEGGTSIGLMTGNVIKSDAIMAVFRGNVAFTTITPSTFGSGASVGPPSNQTVSASGGTAPLVVFGFFASNSTTTRTLSPAATAEISATVNNFAYLDYLLYNSAPANNTVSMTGAANDWMQSGYIQVQ